MPVSVRFGLFSLGSMGATQATMADDNLSPQQVYELLQDKSVKTLVVDMRDSDRAEGWIADSFSLPSEGCSRERMAEFAATTAPQYDVLVFHCMFSQVRGPKFRQMFNNVAPAVKLPAGRAMPRSTLLVGGFVGFKSWRQATAPGPWPDLRE
jgi:hypothetical protein